MKSESEIRNALKALDVPEVTPGPVFQGSPAKTVSLTTRIVMGTIAVAMLLGTIASSLKGF